MLVVTCIIPPPYTVSSVTLSVSVVSGREGTYTVTCRTTGGRALSISLTGPGITGGGGLSVVAEGTRQYRGQDNYTATSNTLSEEVGSVYTCTASNNVSSPEASLELRGI